ncbi:hypothetical protein BH11PLA2_BH11PLA2_27210 [soil metagenome]
MSVRTTLIRCLILAVFAGIGGVAWWAQSYVRPEAVRASVQSTFEEQLPEAKVTLREAHMRVFGGISVRDLSFTKKDDDKPFFAAPLAVIYHDKEQIVNGQLVIRKIELDSPTLRLERHADGRWTFDGLTKPSPADKAVPSFVIKNGTVTLVDKSPNGLPSLTLTEANFTLVNDPPPLFLNVKGSAKVVLDGHTTPVKVDLNGQLHRLTGQFSLRMSANEIPLGPDLANCVKAWKPSLAETLKAFTATASVKADVSYKPDAIPALSYDLEVKLKDGRFSDPLLPVPAEGIEAIIRYRDGKVTIDKATAKLGTCTAEVSLETRSDTTIKAIPPPTPGLVPGTLASVVRNGATPTPELDALSEFEQHFEKIDLTLKDLTLNDDLFDRLGDKAEILRKRFNPIGVLTAGYHFSRPSGMTWRRDLDLKPTRFGITYEKFRYPLTDVVGMIRKSVTSSGGDETSIDLTGTASGQRVDVKGIVRGTGPDPGIDLRISGNNCPIDHRLFEALPKLKHQQALKKLRALGRADFTAEVKQAEGENYAESTFKFQVTDAKFNYALFPYPLESVTGLVTIFVTGMDPARPRRPGQTMSSEPDRDAITFSDFTGKHGNGVITMRGTHQALPRGPDRQLSLHVEGRDCPVDLDMKAALTAIKIDSVWRTFSPRGNMTFAVDVNIADRVAAVPVPRLPPFNPLQPPAIQGLLTKRAKTDDAEDVPFNPATDLAMTLNFTGPSVTPDFFPYDLDKVAGRVRYDGTQIRVEKFTASHGESNWALDAGEVRVFPDGRVWANIGRLDIAPFTADKAFASALPETLKKAAGEMNLRGGAEVTMRHIVVLTPPDAPKLLPKTVARGQSPGVSDTSKVPSNDPDPDIYWSGEVRLNDAAVDAGLEWSHLKGKIATTGRYYGTHLGEVVGNIWLDEGNVADHPLRNVKMRYRADPQTLRPLMKPDEYEPVNVRFADVTGQFFGGTLGGEARVVLSDPVRYRMRLDATDVRLEEVAQHHGLNKNGTLEGLAQASLRLETINDPVTGKPMMDGAGTVDVDHGHLLNLPIMMPLLKTLKLQAPDKTAFDEGHAVFTVRGDRIRVTHLDLLGDAISLGGSGETDLKGQYVKFDFHTIWSQTLQRWLTTPFGDLNGFVSEKLFRIEVSREGDGKMKYEARLVPFITDPFRMIADRAKKRKERLNANK